MALLIGFLTLVLVLNCLFLMLLVLIQLPKKEAGAGIAFGGGATDALFGAGSGNALTKLTKYSATLFIGLALLLTYLNTQKIKQSGKGLERALSTSAKSAPASVLPAPPKDQLLQLQPKTAPAPVAVVNATNAKPITPVITPAAKPATNGAAPKTN
jgi:protein translocase SecG subunit